MAGPTAASPPAAAHFSQGAALAPRQSWIYRLSLWLPLGLALLSGILLVLLAQQLRSDDLANGGALINTFSQVVEEQTSRTLQSVSLTLEQADSRIQRLRDGRAATPYSVQQEFRTLLADRPFLRAIWVLDASGVMIFDSDDGNIGFDLSDRDYFRFHKDNPEAGFQVHRPLLSRTMGRWFISATQPLRDARGAFAGIIVAAIEPLYFDQVWHADPSQGAAITLFRRDGTLLMRSPFDETSVGRSFKTSERFMRAVTTVRSGNYNAVSPIDGKRRLFTYRTLEAYPDLLLFVGKDMDIVLADWRRYTIVIFISWLTASVMLLGAGLALRHEWHARWQAEWQLTRSYDRINTVMDHIADGVIVVDRVGMVRDFRRSAERLFGWTAEEVVGRDAEILLPSREDLMQALANPDATRRETMGRRKCGAPFPIELSVAQVAGPDGETEFVATMHDISARKAVEEQLRQSQKMESIGQLTGGVAHDFNNMLTVILGGAELVTERTEPATPAHRAAQLILASANASAELVRRLLAFSRRQSLEPTRIEIAGFVAKSKELLSRTLGAHIQIAAAVAEDSWGVTADATQLEAAVLNLAINSRDAMPQGGRITITAFNEQVSLAQAAPHGVKAGDYVVVAVADTGSGMSEETIRRAFEPFYTTKEVGKGTGLGLSMVHGFVHQSGGFVDIHSKLGSGTTIRLYLPACKQAA